MRGTALAENAVPESAGDTGPTVERGSSPDAETAGTGGTESGTDTSTSTDSTSPKDADHGH